MYCHSYEGFRLLLISSFLYGIGVLIISFGYTFPLAIQFEQKEKVREVDAATPPFFENADNGNDEPDRVEMEILYS